MDEQNDRSRITWTTRINIRPAVQDAVRKVARNERLSVATVIGLAIDDYVTARSTA